MAIVLTFACGHQTSYDERGDPCCPRCGTRQIVTVQAPAPTFRGLVTGPSAIPEPLPAIAVNLTRKESHG